MITKAKQRTQNTGAPISGTTLRERAEAAFRKKAARSRKGIEPLSLATTLPLLHELQVHQIELEMQNEELRREQDELVLA